MNIRIDASAAATAYSAAFRKLRTLPGFDQQVILRAEMGSILKTWAGRVPVANGKRTDAKSRLAVLKKAGHYLTSADAKSGFVSITAGLRGGTHGLIWFRTRKNIPQAVGSVSDSGAIKYLNRHFRDEDWQAITEGANYFAGAAAAALARGRGSIGLARQSVIQCADQVGIDLASVQGGGISDAGIAKARAAIASSGRAYQNGTGSQGGDETKCYIEAINRLPYGVAIGMDMSLAFVLQGRAKFIETAYKKGAFDSMKKAAAAFPNIFNTAGLS